MVLGILKISPFFPGDWYMSSFLPFDVRQHRVEKYIEFMAIQKIIACHALLSRLI